MPKTSFILGNCRHYRAAGRARPFDEAECERGVNIREHVGGPDFGWCARWPCTGGRMARPDNPMVPCEMYDPPTEEEVAESDAEWAKAIATMLRGKCPQCNADMVKRGSWSSCLSCPDVSMHTCSGGGEYA